MDIRELASNIISERGGIAKSADFPLLTVKIDATRFRQRKKQRKP